MTEAAYLHIPFCRRRCYYCDFATSRGTADLIERYVTALCQQIRQYDPPAHPLTTVFLGGGTPSLLSPVQMTTILTTLRQHLGIVATAEVTTEANPGTLSRSQLADYRAAGINRVSLGVQAFQDNLLELCGRGHGVAEVYQAIDDLMAVGITNFNLDLIFGLPEQTLADWQDSLERLLAIRPSHVSLYDLTIEPGTRFGLQYRLGDQPLPSDETTVTMYLEARDRLTAAGYDHYEIANFALPGYQCRHNRVYWHNGEYYGLGMGAVGYQNRQRYEQPKYLAEYFSQVEAGTLPQAPTTDMATELMDTLMVGLRLAEGVSAARLATFSTSLVKAVETRLQPFIEAGWLTMTPDVWRLSTPDGWLFSNEVFVAIIDTLSEAAVPA